jgi:outer membrane protein TolC
VDERRTAAAAERALGSTAIAAMGGYKRTSGFNTGTAGIAIDLPIGLRNTPARLRADAEATAAGLELEHARAVATLDIEQALLAARVLTEQVAVVADNLVTPAEIARRAARAAFREGTGDALAVVDADRVHLDSQREALALQLDAAAASIRARLALGEDPLP